jgi:3',5'-cyclic AMP phosphodiesterase CpdA
MRALVALLAAAATLPLLAAAPIELPAADDSLRFAVIGDNGTGSRGQYELAQRMLDLHGRWHYELVVMVGDNLYGRQQPQDFMVKFEKPYAPLLQVGVTFQAALGNHDDAWAQLVYPPFNMNGRRYYTFVRKGVRFVYLDTNLLDAEQLGWVERTLKDATETWIIAVLHHPLYSNAGRHGSNIQLRVQLEPIFIRHSVDVVFSGHDHMYERLKPQSGITYFVTGASGQLRQGDARSSPDTAVAYDQDHTFLAAEIVNSRLTFQTISRAGRVVDDGVIEARRPGRP